MKRIDRIKEQLCNIIGNYHREEFELVIYELQNTKSFNAYIIEVLNLFDNDLYKDVSENAISKEMKNGMYSIKFIEWLGEEVGIDDVKK